MNPIAEELYSIIADDDYIEHYGVARRSGRYPWGSGENPYQHSRDFLGRIEELKKQGWTETPENIKKSFGLSTTEYRIEKSLCKNARIAYDIARAKSLQADGLGPTEIGRKMGLNESTVRSLLNDNRKVKILQAEETAKMLKKQVDEKGMIDVGKGVEYELNISREKLDQALYILQSAGYNVYGGRFDQPTNKGQKTTQKVLTKPDIDHKEIFDLDKVKTINEYISRDGGDTFEKKFHYPESLDSKRLTINYAEDGGIDKDGLIELRPGVADLSLGEKTYSQVRIMVDGTHYLKGMAVYSDDLPPGVDVRFNTNKKKGTPILGDKANSVLKPIKNDPDNPFGSLIKDADQGGQYWYSDPKTGEKKLGLINKRSDEGDWTQWKDSLPSQFLSKQSKQLAQKQLNISKADKFAEYEDIMALTNPTIKKYYLNKFSQSCDSAAVDLKAAALPGQKYHVILPVPSLSDKEIYAPGYKDGSQLALIRYPHGGTFEIPIVTVNNKNKDAVKMIGKTSIDAVGINANVAARLSGADFDGDTVMCIPTNDKSGKVRITSTEPLQGLIGFDGKMEYGFDEIKKDSDGNDHYYRNGHEFKTMKKTDNEMGMISNLISDMTIAGAPPEDLERAVRHSMVVIDAEKHHLDYKKSEIDNNIAELRLKYQGKKRGGAVTLISKSSGETDVIKRQGSPHINIKGSPDYDPSRPEGALLYRDTATPTYTVPVEDKRTGGIKYVTKIKTQKSTKMAETDDAYSLVSQYRHPMELIYADYANYMKDLARKARISMVNTGKLAYDRGANKKYASEVKSLSEKLKNAEMNIVRERAATRQAAYVVSTKKKAAKEAGEKLKAKDLTKAGQQAVTKARQEMGSLTRKERNINITDDEWTAIQAGAISENMLKRILNNADPDQLRQRSMPKETKTISDSIKLRAQAMSASYTLEQIADKLGISKSSVYKIVKGET